MKKILILTAKKQKGYTVYWNWFFLLFLLEFVQVFPNKNYYLNLIDLIDLISFYYYNVYENSTRLNQFDIQDHFWLQRILHVLHMDLTLEWILPENSLE